MSVVLSVESVSKRYRIQQNRPFTLKESIIQRLTGRHNKGNTLWALRDVNFSLEQGRSLGIIGHNGAGKSTLLRLLCGLGRPTTGSIQRNGHISGVLELGSGFQSELTGRENLMTGGLLNGLTKRQVLAKQPEIIAFAELEEFIDQPVRTYSTGMYMRLAFAIAIHFDPEVLIIDEVLAVGDSRFQKKCMDRLADFRSAGKTTILTSHDMDQISTFCDEVLVLEEGRVVMQENPESAILCYNDLMRQRTEKRASQLSGETIQTKLTVKQGSRTGTQEASINNVRIYDEHGKPANNFYSGEGLTIVLEYSLIKQLSDLAIILGVYSDTNVKCFETYILSAYATFGSLTVHGNFRCHLPAMPLLPGRYYINVGLYPVDWSFIYDYHWDMHAMSISSKKKTPSDVSGVVSLEPVWSSLPVSKKVFDKKGQQKEVR